MRLLPSSSLLVAPPRWNNGGSHDEILASRSLVAPPSEREVRRKAPRLPLMSSPLPVRRKGGYVIVDGLAPRQRYAGIANPGPGQESARGTVPVCPSPSFYRGRLCLWSRGEETLL